MPEASRRWAGTIAWGLLVLASMVGSAALEDPYSLLRHLAAVVAFPLALGGVVEVSRVRCRRQRG